MVDHIGALDSRFLICFLVGDQVVPKVTNRQVVDYLCWSGKVMLEGIFPSRDYKGRPWPAGSWREEVAGKSLTSNGFGAAFVSTCHDAKARKETHEFRNFYSCKFICDRCPAASHIPRLSHGNCRADCRWREHTVSHEQYMASAPASELSPWCNMPGWRHDRALFDLMHTIHLGTAKDFCAQMISDLCKHGYQGAGPLAEQLTNLWSQFKSYCKKHRIPYAKRKLTAKVLGLKPGLYPEMNSRTKAAHVQPLIFFLAARTRRLLAPKFRKPTDQHAAMRAWCAFGLADCLHTMDSEGILMSPEAAARATTSGRIYLLAWQNLAHAHLGFTEYKVRPKGHYFDHILAQLSTLENPRCLSNFISEDYMGKIVTLARQQHRSTCIKRTVELYGLTLRHRWRMRCVKNTLPCA